MPKPSAPAPREPEYDADRDGERGTVPVKARGASFFVMPEVLEAFPDHEILGTGRASLSCALTESELLDAGQRLAQLQGDLAGHLADVKEAAQSAKTRREHLEDEIANVARSIRRRAVDREISTCVLADYKTNAAITVRQDSAEVLYQRALTPDERQRVLFPDMVKGEGSGEPEGEE